MKKPRRPKPVFDLPTPEEANAAAAELSGSPATPKPSPPKKRAAPRKKTSTRKAAVVRAKEPVTLPPVEKKPIGRPRANHGRRSTSVMVRPEIWKRLKFLALKRDVDLSEMLEDIFLKHLKKEEVR